MTNPLLRFANIIASHNDRVMVAVPQSGMRPDAVIELRLKTDNSFEIYQGGLLLGHIEATPEDAMRALSTARQTLLIEVGPNGAEQVHQGVAVRLP